MKRNSNATAPQETGKQLQNLLKLVIKLNLHILHTDVQNFIERNLKTDITKLVLKGSHFENVPIQEIAEQLISKNKCEQKLPTWFSTKNIYYPPKLNIEQTSSEITAQYKSHLIQGDTIIDLTGGFGIDCYYFAKTFKNVIHCEINSELSQIVSHNLKKLSSNNISTIVGDGLTYLKNYENNLDCIYIDPSRRNDIKGKVFLLKDCLPNVPENLDFLFTKSDTILIKTSPILDITSAIKELTNVKEIHVVAVNNEVKELLFLLDKNYNGQIEITTINIGKETRDSFTHNFNENYIATYSLPKTYLFEPNAAILKSAGFLAISSKFNIDKLQINSHLYTSATLISFPGRRFQIKNCISYNKKSIKSILPNNKANITTRNFPESVEQIRKKTGIKDGGNSYLFFTTNQSNEHIVLICEKILNFI